MPIGQSLPSHSVIVPRKGVIELMRMLDGGDNPLRVQIGSNNIRAHVGDFIFTSKLVDGRFPIIAAFCRRTRTNIWKLAAICSSRRLLARRFSLTRNSAAYVFMSAKTS
ncbi:DNA polymerase III [Escherichia coli]|nr:DNA polymerase III [Escherichia coli]